MTLVELLDNCRGDMTKSAFAECLGISMRMMTAMYGGERRAGRLVLRRLAKRFPEKREEIMTVFLAENGHERATASTPEREVAP